MENKLTALQQLIDWLEDVGSPIGIIKKAKYYLNLEREQIEEAFNAGYVEAEQDNGVIDTVDMKTVSNASEYYTQTFNQ